MQYFVKGIMKMRAAVLIAIILLAGSGAVAAQQALSLKEVIDFALRNKKDVAKARLDVENANYLIQESTAMMLPQINGAGSLTYNPKLQQMALDFNGETQVLKIGTPWQSNAAIQLDQQIFNLSVFNGLKAARTTREFYQLNVNLTEEQVIEKVAESYYGVFKTRSQIVTLDKTIQNTTRIKNVIAGLEENGLAKKIDVDRTTVALNNLNSARIQLENALKLQENALKYLIGMDIATPIVLSESEFQIQPELLIKEDFNLANRTEIQLLEKQEELLKLSKSTISASYYPIVGISANYGYLSQGSRFPYFAGIEKGVAGSDFSAIALNLRVPIFNGYSVRAKVGQAEVNIRKVEADLEDAKLALSLDAENAFIQINNSIVNLESQQSNMELAERVLRNVENNYQNGLSSLTDLLDAENSYADAQNNYTAAIMDYKLAEIKLKKAKGELKQYHLN